MRRAVMSPLRLPLAATLALLPYVALAGPVSTEVGARYESYSFGTYTGDVDVTQTLVPIDLRGRTGETAWSLGLDFTSSTADDPDGDGSLSGVSAFRVGAGRDFVEGRLRVSSDAVISLTDGPYTADERRLLGWVASHELGLPRPLIGQGNQFRADASLFLVGSKRTAVFAGGFGEFRSAFQFRDDGLELDPAELVGAGLGVERSWDDATGRIQLFWEHPGGGQVDGVDAYSLANRYHLGLGFEAPVGSGRGALSADLLSVGSGELLPDWALDSSWIRGGNRLLWSLSWMKYAPAYWGLGLAGTHERGFTGALGHSDWIRPHLVVGRQLESGDLRLRAEYRGGSVREGRSLRGIGFAFTWSREWNR